MRKKLLPLVLFLSVLGFLDASYLTWEHYSQTLPPCSAHWWVDCGKVLTSPYSQWWGIPVAVFGMVQYGVVFVLALSLLFQWRQKISWWLLAQSIGGFLFSLYFVWLQLGVIRAICLYCMGSAAVSTTIFFITLHLIEDKRVLILWIMAMKYQVLKRIFFLIDPEIIHTTTVRFGELLGKVSLITTLTHAMFVPKYSKLKQRLAGISFATPIGLAAGFDYEARLTQILPHIGFGFQSVGTITNQPSEGNPKPRLGRLPQSKSLLVNKGFRNPGAKAIIEKLEPLKFAHPVGISIGQTNTTTFRTQDEVIKDILSSFRLFEKSRVRHSYYELNISCPNIASTFNFYHPKDLDYLLTKIDKLKLKRPVFIKMPISESDATILALLKIIVKHSPVGVIIGNLQKDRHDPAVVASERKNLGPGNLSGKPTFSRSNHLIALTYKKFHPRLIIIGCGGVFTPEDAYTKIALGASLIQMITGLIFQGPQVVAQINEGLAELLTQNEYTSVAQAIGSQKNEVKK